MLKKIVITLAVIIVVFVIVVALQPADYRVVRTTTISAPASTVFAQVNDFHNWNAWSPWAKLDPAMSQSFSGAPAGAGSIYSWSGDSKVGAGRMTLIESHPNELINIKLDFLKPLASTSITEFTFKPEGNQTQVTWSMDGQKIFITKAFSLFASMDKMIGPDFEKGLAQLKSVSEASVDK